MTAVGLTSAARLTAFAEFVGYKRKTELLKQASLHQPCSPRDMCLHCQIQFFEKAIKKHSLLICQLLRACDARPKRQKKLLATFRDLDEASVPFSSGKEYISKNSICENSVSFRNCSCEQLFLRTTNNPWKEPERNSEERHHEHRS